MLITAVSSNGANTTNMFANTNLDFAELIQWNSYVPCNNSEGLSRIKVGTNENISKKLLRSKMIKIRQAITYVKKQNVYDVIYTHNFYDNLDLISKYNANYYTNQVKILLRSNSVSQARKNKITEFMSRLNINSLNV